MIITDSHIKFYRQKKCNPSFAKKTVKKEIAVPIDLLINSQETKKRDHKDINLSNAISLLRLVRSNQERAIKNNSAHYEGYRTLKEYMENCKCPNRKKYYIRWVKRISKTQEGAKNPKAQEDDILILVLLLDLIQKKKGKTL